MTKEQRRVYMQKWREENRDRIREHEREKRRMDALAVLESAQRVDDHVCIMRTNDGRVYVVGGRKE